MSSVPLRDALDDKVNRTFAGKVVRKDLVRKVKVGANVPVFVLEFLLGKYCASSDEMAIQMGLQVVNDTLANNYIRADESMKAQSKVKEKGNWTFIDKIKVRLVDSYLRPNRTFRKQFRRSAFAWEIYGPVRGVSCFDRGRRNRGKQWSPLFQFYRRWHQ